MRQIEFRISSKVLVCVLLTAEIFCLQLMNTCFTFSFQKHKMSGNSLVCSAEVGIEVIAFGVISFWHSYRLLV